MKYKPTLTIALMLMSASASTNAMAQKERSEIAQKYKCNLDDLYASDDEWTEKKNAFQTKTQRVTEFEGTLGQSAQNLLAYFEYSDEITKEYIRLSTYASLKSDVDVRDADNMARKEELELVMIEYSQLSAFDSPELTAIPQTTYEKFIAEEPKLEVYKMAINNILRSKVHTLSDLEEALMAKTQILGNVPYSVHNILSNGEMPQPTITLKDGTEVELSQSNFSQVRASSVKEDRDAAFVAFWDNYKRFEGTYGELLAGNVKQNMFEAKARKYDSSLEAALYANNIPTSVYRSLIDNVNRNLATFHRYLNLKKRLMSLDTLTYADLYAPAVKDVELKYTYDEAQQLVLEAVKPLGDEYVSVIKRAFDEQWIDVYPNKGKYSGAYSNGSVYDVHPYILMNFNDNYEQVGTLIHELGHSMHSYFSNKAQPHATAHYAIFVAEVASTFNEALLDHLMLQKITNKDQRISLLMSMLDGFKGTLFRQTQFAEFELAIHEWAESGKPLTGKVMSDIYGEITRKYYGHDAGVCYVDDRVNVEWAFVPHFYMGFYVYQYSTSFVASQALSEMVLNGNEQDRQRYINFLSAGSSKYPIEILKDAGVDMTTSEPFDKAIEKMNRIMDEIERLM